MSGFYRPFAPRLDPLRMPEPSYFALGRRDSANSLFASPTIPSTPGTPGTDCGTPGEDARLIKSTPVDASQLKEVLRKTVREPLFSNGVSRDYFSPVERNDFEPAKPARNEHLRPGLRRTQSSDVSMRSDLFRRDHAASSLAPGPLSPRAADTNDIFTPVRRRDFAARMRGREALHVSPLTPSHLRESTTSRFQSHTPILMDSDEEDEDDMLGTSTPSRHLRNTSISSDATLFSPTSPTKPNRVLFEVPSTPGAPPVDRMWRPQSPRVVDYVDDDPFSDAHGNAVNPFLNPSVCEVIEELVEEEEEEDGPPYVAPLMEELDPQIPTGEPESTTVVPPRVASGSHPWSHPPYNMVERPVPTIRPITATIKIAVSLSVVGSLMIGYGLKLKIVTFGAYSFGMYGLLLIIDFCVQATAATINRKRIVKLTRESPLTKGVAALHNKDTLPTTAPQTLPEVSIAVVGYREDEEAWIACLKSLQAQEYPIKHIIGVVDGNDGPDRNMAEAFLKAFPEGQALVVHLPVLLSVMYKEKYWEAIRALGYAPPTRWEFFKMWFSQKPRPGQEVAHEVAWNHMLDYLHQRATEDGWANWKGICFTEPHGHKRHAMFTSFVVGAYALGTKDAMLTTDSDTYVYPDAVTNLMALLFSKPELAGVTGDVRIWNKKDSFLARMSSLRYWFAFNVERACQSAFGCVGCLSGPLGLYKISDLMGILGPWILQSFLGKETTFGDDRHLSNRILSLGHKTGYTHLARCDSDTPAYYVRWVKQQTRWSKSFFREAFWFPKSFAYHDFWLTVETTKQFMYPMILTATVLQMLYNPGNWTRPIIWLATMFGVATIKSLYGVIAMRDPEYLLFGAYGFMYFFGLLPSKLFASFTVGITTWGTSARSKSEFARPESLYSRTTHVGHLMTWYLMLSFGLAFFLYTNFHSPLYLAVGAIGFFPVAHIYSDVIIGETRYALYMLKKWRQGRKGRADTKTRTVRRWRVVRRAGTGAAPAAATALPATDGTSTPIPTGRKWLASKKKQQPVVVDVPSVSLEDGGMQTLATVKSTADLSDATNTTMIEQLPFEANIVATSIGGHPSPELSSGGSMHSSTNISSRVSAHSFGAQPSSDDVMSQQSTPSFGGSEWSTQPSSQSTRSVGRSSLGRSENVGLGLGPIEEVERLPKIVVESDGGSLRSNFDASSAKTPPSESTPSELAGQETPSTLGSMVELDALPYKPVSRIPIYNKHNPDLERVMATRPVKLGGLRSLSFLKRTRSPALSAEV